MADDDPESNEAVSVRLRRLRRAYGFVKSSGFAAFLGVSPTRWSNFERGLPLSRDMSSRLTKRIPGLTLDWLYRGRSEGLPLELARRLGALDEPGKATKEPS